MYLSGVVIVVIIFLVFGWIGNAKRQVALSVVGTVQNIEHEVSQLVQSLCVEAARCRIALLAAGLEPPDDPSLAAFAEERLHRIAALTGAPVDTSSSGSVLKLVSANWFESPMELDRWVNVAPTRPTLAIAVPASPGSTRPERPSALNPRAMPLPYDGLTPAFTTRNAPTVARETEKTGRERRARHAYAGAMGLKKGGYFDDAYHAFRRVAREHPDTVAGRLAGHMATTVDEWRRST